VDANSHTNFSLPPARALRYFISPPSFLPKIQKANPCLLCRLTFPTISQILTPSFFLSPSIYLRLSLCRLLFLSLWRNGSGRRRRRTGLALPPSLVKLSEIFFFPPPPTTSRPGMPSSSRSTRPPGLPSSL
jgi:hypothetical protein